MKNFLVSLWKIFRHVFLLPLYCMKPDKYSGLTYEEWLNEGNNNQK